jgi:hypothetical protein
MRETWPNFFLVGAAKAGTSSVYAYLSQHPQVFFPRIKEPHFFTQVRAPAQQRPFVEAITDRAEYLRLFRDADRCEVVGDASPSYLWHQEVPHRIRAQVPDAKIAILLRDPVERAYSHYLMDYREGVQDMPFYEALVRDLSQSEKGWGISSLYFELGQYARQVSRYLETFPPERIRILFFEDFRRDVKCSLSELVRFLELDAAAIDRIYISKVHNPYAAPRNELMRRVAGARISRTLGRALLSRKTGEFVYERYFVRHARKPPIDLRARDLLCALYDPEVAELEKLLGHALPQLRRSWHDA